MLSTIQKLTDILEKVPAQLLKFSEEESTEKMRPGKWSKKEIIGHLIDSAANNHQRFVRLQQNDGLYMPQYDQDDWVKIQHYNERSWKDLITLWQAYNTHLLHVMRHVKSSSLENTAIFPDAGTFTLKFIMLDYVVHLEHHLRQAGIE
jgi:hypothetical protein